MYYPHHPHYPHPPYDPNHPYEFNNNNPPNTNPQTIHTEDSHVTSEVIIIPDDSKDKKSVQFKDDVQHVDITKESKKSTRGKRSSKNNKVSKPPTRKSPRKKGGILGIAVEKVVLSDDDDMQVDENQLTKTESFNTMDTESDYNTQTDQNDETQNENSDFSE